MRTIIANDLSRLYGRIDYDLLQKTKLSTKTLKGATTLPVINSNGFLADDYICINNPGNDHSEIRKITSITDQNIELTAAITFDVENKTNIYKIGYDTIRFYGGDSVVGTIAITPDYLVSVPLAVQSGIAYSMTFYNSTTTKETIKGEAVYDTDSLLCSAADIFAFESLEILGSKIIDKVDIASRNIRNIFRGQSQNISAVDSRDLLRTPCALATLYYIFLELSKTKGDISSVKSDKYFSLYESEIKKILDIISLEDSNVNVTAQTWCTR